MNLRQMKYFVTIAEELNIGRAAKRLHLSQPPLTRQLQHMEEEIGVPLFTRTRLGVELTGAGQVLLEEARQILALTDRARERAALAGHGRLGRLDIGVFGSNVLALPPLLSRFRSKHPLVDIVVHTMSKVGQVDALREKKIAAGFNLLGSKLVDIASDVVHVEPLMLAIPEGEAIARRTTVSLASLAGLPLVVYASGPRPNLMDVVFGLCREEGFQPRLAQEVVDSVTAIALVAAGFGVCLVPRSATHLKLPGVVYRAIARKPAATVELHCIYRHDETSPLARSFVAELTRQRRTVND
jgi:DNA-binding transcriptional LysR family regulator